MLSRRKVLKSGTGLLTASFLPKFFKAGLATFVGPVPAALNMLFWTATATYTDFSNAYFATVNASFNSTIFAPDGTHTGQHLAETNANGNHAVNTKGAAHPLGIPRVLATSAVSWRVAVIVKPAERTRIVIEWGNNVGTASSVGFDLVGLAVFDSVNGANTTVIATSIRSLGDGWCLCTFDFSYSVRPPSSFIWVPQIYIDAGTGSAARNISYVGTTGNGVYLWWWNILPVVSWSLRQTFFDDFESLSTIDIADSRLPGFNWYTHNTWPNAAFKPPDTQQPPTPLGVLTISSPSVLRIYNPNSNATSYTSQIMSACTDGANGYIGNAWNGPVVFDTYTTWDQNAGAPFVPLPTLWPSIWGESLEMRANFNLDASGHYIEVDTMEAPSGQPVSFTVHSDTAIPPAPLNQEGTNSAIIPAYPTFQRTSTMWITMASNDGIYGTFIYFANGMYPQDADFAYSNTGFPTGTSAYHLCDGHHLPIIFDTSENTSAGAFGGWPFYIHWVKVYT